ncbi:C4-dicarboxylate transporter DcuC [Endozoicomonas gorgoniicola]|uniref:C4-dicarboxylate transporter DcuC n=1 Tax=Endozoicomonas gorgoniicola TaxID=1234144 RepID=A0ABT3MUQ8_9GAMM|nr:C4-dicarboxylate transporter DcuC [Endozoicomonas gorgoniicola]MCW7553115.1 C4-dicarboxylate transporter DcuC [Endozoicomonas gorgoniicola]
MDILIVIPVVALVVYGIVKNFSAAATLAVAGMVLLSAAHLLGITDILPVDKATGFAPFDLFELMNGVFSMRMASLGLTIMACGGFATYMSHIGASESLVNLAVKPIRRFKSPYIVLSVVYLVTVVLQMFVTSATGLGLLLMVTLYPVLRSIGLSRASAAALCASPAAFEIGVTQVNANFAASQSGMDITEYFLGYQAWVTIPMAITAAALHFFWQRRCDLKEGHVAAEHVGAKDDDSKETEDKPKAPGIYALLPMIPFVLLLVFSKMLVTTISMKLVAAMLISVFVGMIFELIRTRNIKESLAGFDKFLNGMGAVFGPVVGLIIGAEVFAMGLKQIGAIDSLLASAQGLGIGAGFMAVFMSVLIAISAIMMGSGNAAFLSFATLAPNVANSFGVPAVNMLLPMNFAACVGRTMSPISAVVIACSGIAKVSPFDLVKRTAIPMMGSFIVGMTLHLILFM